MSKVFSDVSGYPQWQKQQDPWSIVTPPEPAVFLLISGNNSDLDFQALKEVRAVYPVIYLIPQATSQSWDPCPISQKADKQTRQMTPML